MSSIEAVTAPRTQTPPKGETLCYHCGTPCSKGVIRADEKDFCCEGCKVVYELLSANGLCSYYEFGDHPGLTRIKAGRRDKFAYLDSESITESLYTFTNGDLCVVTFYLPGVHCSSCMWLLEHLSRINSNITESRLNFSAKEITIHFLRSGISLRQVVELLTTIGYEPYISLEDHHKSKPPVDRSKLYKLGVAGFCFGNIMMMSFPEYFSFRSGIEKEYAWLFRGLNLLLALPVFFYSASEFFGTAWKGLKQRTLNIDAPVALAILITFVRSLYEIISGTGAGYLDSMSGIVFFMLAGRVVQERTYGALSFHRDYQSYFPLAVDTITDTGIESKQLFELREGDIVRLHHEEIVPADAVILEGEGRIDYAFVTGESIPLHVQEGEKVYAGGKQTGGQLTIRLTKPVAGSYLTSLWNHHSFARDKQQQNDRNSTVHKLSHYFTWVLFAFAAITGIFWAIADPSKILSSVTAMLIVACPCALLLSSTFANGNLLRLFSNNGLFLRDATVIEQLGTIDTIVLDKTGTLTETGQDTAIPLAGALTDAEKEWVSAAATPSRHPYSKALARSLNTGTGIAPDEWEEVPGKGVRAAAAGHTVLIGSAAWVGLRKQEGTRDAVFYVCIDEGLPIPFGLNPRLRKGLEQTLGKLRNNYLLALLSGDKGRQKALFKSLLGERSELRFEQQPEDKLKYIAFLQAQKHKVLMIGDGLNDAGALQQSDAGITLADDINNFTPSCDAILDAGQFTSLPGMLCLAKAGGRIIRLSFFISILYNIVGLYFAVQAKLNPMIAAILMPASTLSIVLVTTGFSSLAARRYGLRAHKPLTKS